MAMRAVLAALLIVLGVACNQPQHLGRPLSSWIYDLDAPEDYKRKQACEAMAAFGPAASAALPRLMEMLNDPNDGVQEFARHALTRMGDAAVAPLEAALGHEVPRVRLHAAAALLSANSAHAGAMKQLVDAVVAVGNAGLARDARDVIVKVGAPAVPHLIAHLSDPYAPVRAQVMGTLRDMGGAAAAAVEPLAQLLGGADAGTRKEILITVASIGARERVEPLLRAAMTDADEDVADTAGAMLKHIGARDSASGNETAGPK